MTKEYSDKEIINVIEKLLNGEGTEEQLEEWCRNELKNYPGILDLIFYGTQEATSVEILQMYKERYIPISLLDQSK